MLVKSRSSFITAPLYLRSKMGEQHAMANLPAIAEGVAAEEQILMAEASSVSRNADLQKLRQDKREFIKVSRPVLVSATLGLTWKFTGVQGAELQPDSRTNASLVTHLQANRRALANSPKFGETFGKIQSTDMPPQFRAILEDNRARLCSGWLMLIAFFQLALHCPADTAKLGYQLS